ncbi:MAG: hypothetical protein Q4C54_06015 [Clostridia bacterium]|nr:hypothetical protein [Clostridia bacterium]
MLIQNAVIHDAVHPETYVSDILVRDGKIAAIGTALSADEGEQVLDASGLQAYPGFIDAHSHLGLDDWGGDTGGSDDYNEMNDICCPNLRGMDSYYPMDPSIRMALEGGVTCVCTGPGSANVLGGTFLAVKTVGNTVEEAAVKTDVAMKCAFGENPKRCYASKCNSARMTTAARMR